MRIQNVFYTVGVLFIVVAVLYFTFQFIRDLAPTVKFVILVVSVLVSFIVAELLRGSNL